MASGPAETVKPSLFVTYSRHLRGPGRPGGVQICTQEYMDTLRAAGYPLEVVPYESDRRPLTRLRRLLRPRPYQDLLPPDLHGRIIDGCRGGVRYVFLNQVELAPLAELLRARLPGCPVVLLSHGLESVDYLHFLRAEGLGAPFARLTAHGIANLGRKLVAECRHRRHLDLVFTLAPFEAEIERWLGARRVDWLPRTVEPRPVGWSPGAGRLGFVGTFNHPPNAEGLALVLRSLAKATGPNFRVRVVGGPPDAAREVVANYSFADYLGPLGDDELRREAATWDCFLHPLFCYARGCSTKLAIALGWGVPVVTTPAGARGYTWREGSLPMAETPEAFASQALRLLDGDASRSAAREVAAVARTSPTFDEVAAKARAALDSLTGGAA
jgi:glycosyltransferase involved in cell wall biosynthesis